MAEKADDWDSLLRAANGGDGAAYAAFLRAAAPVLRGIVRSRAPGLDAHSREDLVQEVLLAIHLKRQTWTPDRPVRPWVYAIARYKIIDTHRRRARDGVQTDDGLDNVPSEPVEDPFEARDVGRLIDRLDARSGGILRAIAFEGASLQDICTRLAITEGAARVALHRALRKLASLRAGDRT
jgi:RNA polymerase sigma factor (sigma-70 family)